ncbi:ER lumen protein retaining receptor [Lactarius tabidus]
MNIFRLLADLSHLASILILLRKIQTTRSCRGISFKTQALYSTVFLTRYLDLFTTWHSLYNFVMKIFFIGSSLFILYLMKIRFRPTHDPSIDTFRVEYLIAPSLVLALLFNYSYSIIEVVWSFSIFLESIAILPQLFILQRTGEAETITTHYLAALGAYRGLYIPNWIYRSVELAPLPGVDSLSLTSPFVAVYSYYVEDLVDPISIFAGVVQTGLYLDFFYVYFTKVLQGQKFELPA